jgi:hypothetical protein
MRATGPPMRADQENIGRRFNPIRAAAFLNLSVQEVAVVWNRWLRATTGRDQTPLQKPVSGGLRAQVRFALIGGRGSSRQPSAIS